MIYIIHGDDTVSSSNKLATELTGKKNIIVLNAEKTNTQSLEQAFASQDLFAVEKCIVIEKFLKFKKAEMDALVALVHQKEKGTTVYLWHNTELSKIALAKFKQAQVFSYILPKLFFAFLDNLTPKMLQKELDTLAQMDTVEDAQIFYATVKRVRLMLYLKMGIQNEEISKMNSWQLSKIQAQSNQWSVSSLQRMYEYLITIEIRMKSGGLLLPVRQELDRALIQELN